MLAFAMVACAVSHACGGSSEEGLYGGSGAKSGIDAALDGTAGTIATGGSAGSAGSIATGGSAGSAGTIATGGGAGTGPIVDAAPDVPLPPPKDAGPDGNDPIACPPLMPQSGSPCNIFVNVTDCVYGFKHCVCTVTTWLCVP